MIQEKYLELNFVLPLSTKKIDNIVVAVQQMARLYKENEEIIQDKIPLVLDEALRNCIIHGNNNCPDKNISLKVAFRDNSILFVFEDSGEGFNYKSLLKNLKEEKKVSLNIRNGRGVLLLSQVADCFSYSRSGRKLEIVLKYALE